MVYTTSEAKHAYPGEKSTPAKPQVRLIGLKAIADYTGYSETTIKKRVHEEGFPAGKTGGTWVSIAEEIDAWFASRVTPGVE